MKAPHSSLLDAPSRCAAALLPRVWSRLPAQAREVFLTFDDGPSEATMDVLEILAAHEAHATFFALGAQIAGHGEVAQALRRAGHTLGSHGQRHTDPWRVRDRARWNHLDPDVRWLRPPFGHLTPGLLRHAIRHDRHVALWDVMPADFDPALSPETVAARVLRRIRLGSIVVLHDGPEMRGRIGAVLRRLLPRLRDDGWQMRPLPDQPRTAP